MDHAEGRGRAEPVPVSCAGRPGEVVPQEGIICRKGVHRRVAPDCRGVHHRVAVSCALFYLLDEKHVSVVVLLQKLEVEALADVPIQNGEQLVKANLVAALLYG